MKDWLEEWKVPVTPKKVPKYKKQEEDGPSKKSSIPTTNTWKETKHAPKEQQVVQPPKNQGRQILSQSL
jgi:hypothetical protein